MVDLMDMSIIRITDDAGYLLGYFDINTENGFRKARETIENTLIDFEDNEMLEKFNDFIATHTWDEITYSMLNDLLINTFVYLEPVDIER